MSSGKSGHTVHGPGFFYIYMEKGNSLSLFLRNNLWEKQRVHAKIRRKVGKKGENGMEDKKRDLIPIAAIAVFLVIIIILCVVRLKSRGEGRQDEVFPESIDMMESVIEESQSQTMTESREDTEDTKPSQAAGKETENTQEDTLKNELPRGKEKTASSQTKDNAAKRTISGNDPFAAAQGVNKTNEEMLMEMAGYWEQGNQEAVDDLANLAWYRKMSDSIRDENTFYYYGERNSSGQPHGTGVACYADNAYYYGEWVNGKREGNGKWLHYYVYYDDDLASDRAYNLHMYAGDWANDMPNGEGQEHYDLDMSKAAKNDRYLQNVIGTFRDGLYSGEMYLTTLDPGGKQEEWNGIAEEGIWSPYGAATNKKEVPVCRDVANDDNYLWLMVKNNKERGIEELMP